MENGAVKSGNSCVFMVGGRRSGTTLLRRIVEAHSGIAMAPETQWIAEYYKKRIGLTPEGRVTPELTCRLLAHPKFHHLGISAADLDQLLGSAESTSYADFVGRLFEACAKSRGKPFVGAKTPNYVRQIPWRHTFCPDA